MKRDSFKPQGQKKNLVFSAHILGPRADESGEAVAVASAPPLDSSEESMDFDQAISAHSNWKSKLRTYLAKPDGSLMPSDVAADGKCDLGKWIAGEGAKHANMLEFQTLRSEHARFHKAAADVIRHADWRAKRERTNRAWGQQRIFVCLHGSGDRDPGRKG